MEYPSVKLSPKQRTFSVAILRGRRFGGVDGRVEMDMDVVASDVFLRLEAGEVKRRLYM